MAEANPDTGTISDEAAMDLMFEEPGANLEDPDHAAPAAEVTEGLPEVAAEDLPPGEAEAEPVAQAQTFTVKIDGKEETVALDELLSGYQRQQDYTRKTTETARAREQIEVGTATLKNLLQQWMVPQDIEPDWVKVSQEHNPQEFVQMQAEWQARQRKSQQARKLYDQVAMQEHSGMLQREQAALVQRIPEWSDKAVARSELASITKAAAGFGFSEAEIGAVTDHRVILMARQLAKYQNAEAALASQRQATPPATVAPQGRARSDDVAARNQKLLDTVKRTGSDEAALAYLLGG